MGGCCGSQHNVGRCSGSKKYLYTLTVPSPYLRAIFYHDHFSPRIHMLSSTSWFTLAPSFHEHEIVGHKLTHKWHQNSLPHSQKSDTSPPLHQHSLVSTSFFITATSKTPNLAKFKYFLQNKKSLIQHQYPP